jgi:hypothetical protein
VGTDSPKNRNPSFELIGTRLDFGVDAAVFIARLIPMNSGIFRSR